MKIVVCVKIVPDTTTRIRIDENGRAIAEADIAWIVSPYDEFAIEEGLRLREKHGGEVLLLSVGPDRVQAGLRNGLAMGADSAFQIWDPSFASLDVAGRATALAAAIRHLGGVDLILCGQQGVGDDDSQVGGLLAAILDLPLVSAAIKIDLEGGAGSVEREVEGGVEVWDVSLPLVITAEKGLNTPRYAGLKGIMAAKKKSITVLDAAGLGLSVEPSGGLGARTERPKMTFPAERPPVRMIGGEPNEQSRELLRLLHEEAKVI
jgi:electron transfer flavoprotein beta subunit